MFKRALSATAPCLKPQPQAHAQVQPTPLRRVRDPLLSSRSAQHYTLESGHSFIVRPPPSVVPPSHPFPPQPTAAAAPSDRLRVVSTRPLEPLLDREPTPIAFNTARSRLNKHHHLLPPHRGPDLATAVPPPQRPFAMDPLGPRARVQRPATRRRQVRMGSRDRGASGREGEEERGRRGTETARGRPRVEEDHRARGTQAS